MQTPAPAATGSLITPCGYGSSPCAYCKSQTGRTSIAATLTSLEPAVYQCLVDRGWRRAGTYLYKPDCRNSCCPNYTIRLDAASCRPRRDHRQAINAWNKFILGYGYRSKAARLCPRTREEKKWRKNHFDLQTAIHETESINIYRPIDPKTKELVGPAKEFEVHLESDSYTEEKYALFAHYQRHVHKEGPSEITKSGFKGFLCSGLGQSSRLRNGVVQKLGSYHQCYRLDGRLVAMGVLDLLPDCVSSVYLIYHPDVKDWYFGKLSALREIALAVEGGYHYYYMGFYIHSCIKMRYKNQYQPSYLLDPETYSWDPLDADYLARLSARKYVSLSVERQLHLPPHKLTGIDKLKLDEESFLRLREYQQEFGPDGSTRRGALGSRMPGLMSLEEVEDMIDLGKWTLKYGNMLLHLEDLRDWATWDIHDPSSLKRAIAELAAALGPGLVSQLVLALG